MQMQDVGKWLVGIGAFLLLVGLLIIFLGKVFHLERLPGDIVWRKDNVTVYIPITTMILLSLLLTILLNLVFRLFGGK